MENNKTLETVDEYCRRKYAEESQQKKELMMTGVSCPLCGDEMGWAMVYAELPYFRDRKIFDGDAFCRKCRLTITLGK